MQGKREREKNGESFWRKIKRKSEQNLTTTTNQIQHIECIIYWQKRRIFEYSWFVYFTVDVNWKQTSKESNIKTINVATGMTTNRWLKWFICFPYCINNFSTSSVCCLFYILPCWLVSLILLSFWFVMLNVYFYRKCAAESFRQLFSTFTFSSTTPFFPVLPSI